MNPIETAVQDARRGQGARSHRSAGVSKRETFMVETSTSSGASVNFSGTMLIIEIVWLVLVIAGMWMTFAKAGKPGWGAIIPICNL
jgi:hypothetical protein